jgi:D-arabinose 1-dehydrogenase-like Zn-dependent alcohol dehydrogenase
VRANGVEKRKPLALEAKALIVRQMQVQAVEPVERQQIDDLLDRTDREKVAADIQRKPAPAKARLV